MSKNTSSNFFKESGFILAMIGSAVGFANLLSFSAQCYKNGGGAFLVPFLIANLIIGLPMLFLEGIIGQHYKLPLVSAYGQSLGKKWKIFGWIATISCLTIGSFYSVLTSWSVVYTYLSSIRGIPQDSGKFFEQDFLKVSSSILDFGSISYPILIATIFVFAFSWFVVHKSIKDGIEKICSIFMPLLFIILILFSIIVCFLPGSEIGIYNYLKPDFSKLKNFDLWKDVFSQVFFSLSLGIGIVVGYSRHTKKEINMKKAMLWVVGGDVLVSVVAGFAIFACVGFMSQKTGIDFKDIIKSDSSFQMGFVVFPQILNTFPYYLQPIIGSLFFFCVFIAGITGVFSIIESVAGNIETEFKQKRSDAVTIATVLMFILSIFFLFGNSVHILGAISPMVLGYVFLIGGIAQVIAFIIKNNIIKNTYYYFLTTLGTIFLIISFTGSLYEEFLKDFDIGSFIRWGWFLLTITISIILSFLA